MIFSSICKESDETMFPKLPLAPTSSPIGRKRSLETTTNLLKVKHELAFYKTFYNLERCLVDGLPLPDKSDDYSRIESELPSLSTFKAIPVPKSWVAPTISPSHPPSRPTLRHRKLQLVEKNEQEVWRTLTARKPLSRKPIEDAAVDQAGEFGGDDDDDSGPPAVDGSIPVEAAAYPFTVEDTESIVEALGAGLDEVDFGGSEANISETLEDELELEEAGEQPRSVQRSRLKKVLMNDCSTRSLPKALKMVMIPNDKKSADRQKRAADLSKGIRKSVRETTPSQRAAQLTDAVVITTVQKHTTPLMAMVRTDFGVSVVIGTASKFVREKEVLREVEMIELNQALKITLNVLALKESGIHAIASSPPKCREIIIDGNFAAVVNPNFNVSADGAKVWEFDVDVISELLNSNFESEQHHLLKMKYLNDATFLCLNEDESPIFVATGSEPNPIECPKCRRVFKTQTSCRQHISAHILNRDFSNVVYPCLVCGENEAVMAGNNTGCQMSLDKDKKKFKVICQTFGEQVFGMKISMNGSRASPSTNVVTKCGSCDKLVTSYSMEKHMQEEHTGEWATKDETARKLLWTINSLDNATS
jgi:hypothetical protein